MHRLMSVIVLAMVVLIAAGPAFASSCPKLVKQIDEATAIRYDPTAADAKVKAQEGAALHAAGKHAESMKVLQDALKSLDIK